MLNKNKKIIAFLLVIAMFSSALLSFFPSTVSAAGTTTPFYEWKQDDPQWADVYIGNNTIGNIGCYVTSAAMLIVYGGLKTEENFDPATLVSMLKEVGGFAGNLIYKGKINKAVPGFDYRSEVLLGKTQSEKTQTIAYYLNKGYYIIAGVKNLGHYVAIREVKDGVVYMMDPAGDRHILFDHYAPSGVTKIFLYTSTGKKVNIDSPTAGDTTTNQYVTGIYETTDDLNLREFATTSSTALTIIPKGSEITVKEVDGIWGKVTFGNMEGFICLDYTKLISEQIFKDPADVSEEPSSEEPSSEEPSSEEPSSEEPSSEEPSSEEPSSKEPSSEDSSSEEPDNNNSSTETPSEYVPGIYKTTGSINLRKEPNTSCSILGVVPKNATVTITEIIGTWGKTTYNGKDGYIGLRYTTLLEASQPERTEIPVETTTSGTDGFTTSPSNDEYLKGYYTTTDNPSLRLNATTSSSRLAIIPKGTKIQVSEIKNGWGKVFYNQLEGWCSLDYCTYNEPYAESTTFVSGNILGVLSTPADISSLRIDINYSDGSVYTIKSGISVSYTIPTSAGTIQATAKYNGNEYTFKILYVENCNVVYKNNTTFAVVNHIAKSEEVFSNNSISLKTNGQFEENGIKFTIVVLGDVDGSGDITTTDYLRIKQYFLGGFPLNDGETIGADVNRDGEINSTDYLSIKTILSK